MERIKALDISGEQQAQLIQSLESKYSQQFAADPTFNLLINAWFDLQHDSIQAHVVKFPAGVQQLKHFLENKAAGPTLARANSGFFAPGLFSRALVLVSATLARASSGFFAQPEPEADEHSNDEPPNKNRPTK